MEKNDSLDEILTGRHPEENEENPRIPAVLTCCIIEWEQNVTACSAAFECCLPVPDAAHHLRI